MSEPAEEIVSYVIRDSHYYDGDMVIGASESADQDVVLAWEMYEGGRLHMDFRWEEIIALRRACDLMLRDAQTGISFSPKILGEFRWCARHGQPHLLCLDDCNRRDLTTECVVVDAVAYEERPGP